MFMSRRSVSADVSCLIFFTLGWSAGVAHSQECNLPEMGISLYGVSAVVLGDVNNDGELDLVATSRQSNTVSVYFGLGSGEWILAGSNPIGEGPDGVHLIDLDHDGALDIVTVNSETNGFGDLSVLLNNGSGGFNADTREGTLQSPSHTAVADMNGDGFEDLIVVSRVSSSILVHSGVSPSLNATITIPGVSSANHFDVGDIDGDGDPDLVVTRAAGSNNVQVFLNNGTGVFTNVWSLTLGTIPVGVAIIDANQDGTMDLALPTVVGEIQSARGLGSGVFLLDQQYGVLPGVSHVQSVDMNDDGIKDLVLTDAGSSLDPEEQITMLISDSGAALSTMKTAFTGLRAGKSMAIAQLDGVGMLDLMTVSEGTNELRPIYSGTDNLFQSEVRYEPGRRPVIAVTGDIDNDGDIDIVTPNFGSRDLGVMLNRGDGSFEVQTPQPFGVNTASYSASLDDLDGDGNLDVVLSSGNYVWFQNGDGSGLFGAPTVLEHIPTDPKEPDYGGRAFTNDYDQDGDVDVFWTLPPVGSVHLFRNNGAGGFSLTQGLSTGPWPDSYAMGDLDGNGTLDLAHTVNDPPQRLVGISYNNGTGFDGPVFIDVGAASRHVRLHDFDLDGDLDLLVHGIADFGLSLIENLGSEQFAAPAHLSTPFQVSSSEITDIDDDGLPDIILLSRQTSENQVLLNQGGLVFTEGPIYSMGDASVRQMSLADLNNDSVTDFIIANSSHVDGDTVSVFLRSCETSTCVADMDGNGVLNFFDVSAFLVAYLDNDPAVDFNNDGTLNFFDVSAFLVAYQEGCP